MEKKHDKRIVVQSLIGTKQLSFYLWCLKSLIEFSEDHFDLHLHTDGSLSQTDEDFIHSELNGTKVTISNSTLNTDHVLDCLSGRPNCQIFRKESIWGIEFFEPLFVNLKDPVSYYLDADILFLQPFAGLFNRSQTETGAIFLKDTQWDAYCLRPSHFIGDHKKPEVVEGINTGLVFWDKRAIDWDYLEWFLGAHHLHHIPEWIMPTAQAGLANRCNAKTVCPRQITNLYPNAKISDQTFGAHLYGSYRKNWIEKLEKDENRNIIETKNITPCFHECRKQTAIGYSIKQIKRWKNTRLNLW
ncbi:MAG: hypothetical protein HN548_02485 [Opitutae bacterium]|jgi:hypothetical protein|nr:hypothetical protein [Opitutae bacterium]